MNLTKWAVDAVGWLKLALQALSIIKPKKRGLIIKVDKALRELVRMEQAEGATTNAWNEILAAAAENRAPTNLTAADAVYLASFKTNWFDKYFKKPLQLLYGLTDLEDSPPES